MERKGRMEDGRGERQERLLRASEVAAALNISKAKTYKLLQVEEIPVVRIGRSVRVRPSDLREYVQRRRMGNFDG